MALHEIKLPYHNTYNFGIGIDRLSGSAMNQVVNPIEVPPIGAMGAIQSFTVSRISTTEDLQQVLGIDLDASYGCASFGAGVSGRFSFAHNSTVHTESLFMAIYATVHLAALSIPDCVLTSAAGQVVDRPDIFTAKYGDMFARACDRGGTFVGMISIETFDQSTASKIEGELHGSYGAFSADAKAKFSDITSKYQVSVWCTVYSEGGPPIQITDPRDPKELLDHANSWMTAMFTHPDQNAVAYMWTFAPISIAEGPLPLNAAEIEQAQDVLVLCARERAELLDQQNKLHWWINNKDKYDWSQADPLEKIIKAERDTQSDLDLVAACASAAIDNPGHAVRPVDYAKAQTPPQTYRLSDPLPTGPKPLPAPTAPSIPSQVQTVQIPDVTNMSVAEAIQTLTQLGLTTQTQQEDVTFLWYQLHTVHLLHAPDHTAEIIGTVPDAGAVENPGTLVIIRVPRQVVGHPNIVLQ